MHAGCPKDLHKLLISAPKLRVRAKKHATCQVLLQISHLNLSFCNLLTLLQLQFDHILFLNILKSITFCMLHLPSGMIRLSYFIKLFSSLVFPFILHQKFLLIIFVLHMSLILAKVISL